MARIARAVVPNLPHHITQRGNRRQQTFFTPGDYALYVELMAKWCRRCPVDIWAYCLMPNHVHLIAVPSTTHGLSKAIGEAHRQYTCEVNRREGWTGYLWQGRFASFAMDDRHTIAAARYVELNPVRAGIVQRPAQYLWSSARAHLARRNDALVVTQPLLARVPDWSGLLRSGSALDVPDHWRRHERTGRPIGTDEFVDSVEARLGRTFKPRRRGRPKRGVSDELRIVSPN